MPLALFTRPRKARKKRPPPVESQSRANRRLQSPPECCRRYKAGSSCSCWSCQNNDWASDELGRLLLASYHGEYFTTPTMGADNVGRIYKDGVPLSRRVRRV